MCGSNPGAIQPTKTTNLSTLNQVLAYGFQDCEEIISAHLRIGHSYITHSYLLKGEEEPQCIPCNALLTIKHILVDCVEFAPIRQRFFHVDSLMILFDTVKFESIIDFLKEIHLYKKI